MNCLICHKKITKKLIWKSLFQEYNYLRCDKCDSRYPISLNTKIYELENGIIDIYRLFSKKIRVNSYAYIYELGQLAELIYKRYEIPNDNTIILYYDDSVEAINNYRYLDELFKLVDKIVIFTMY